MDPGRPEEVYRSPEMTQPQPVPILREPDPHRSLRARGCSGLPTPIRPPWAARVWRVARHGRECLSHKPTWFQAQFLASFSEAQAKRLPLLSSELHYWTFLFTGNVFLALTAFITNPKVTCIDSLMVRGRGLTPSFTQNQLNPRTSRNWFPALPDSL